MVLTIIVLALTTPALVKCAGYGNIHLLEDEVNTALKACSNTGNDFKSTRQRRSDEYANNDQLGTSSRIDSNTKTETNQYNHERRNTTNREQLSILNATDYDYAGYGTGSDREKFVNSVPRPALGSNYNSSYGNVNRTKRSDPLLNKVDPDQCLSQCVFANLQVVDPRGIPREAELWNKVQSSLTSQQSRAVLKDQIRACFQELQSEAEDNGCSYSNKLERCLMLRFTDRKHINHTTSNSSGS